MEVMSCDRLALARVLRRDLSKNPGLDRSRNSDAELRNAHSHYNSVDNLILGGFIF